MWTRKKCETGIAHLEVYLVQRTGVGTFYVLVPEEGYVVLAPGLNFIETAEDGTEKKIPYVSHGGGTEMPTYDWKKNPKGYCAVLEQEAPKC